jgi:iron complex outermembrane receptor protein
LRPWAGRLFFKKEALASFTLVLALAPIARAQTALNLGSVTAEGNGSLAQTPGTASYIAPTIAPMNATQPTSDISQQSIQNNFSSTASYSDIVKLSPSVSGTDPDGPGLMESQVLSIRGFQDGQYNVTFGSVAVPIT